MGSPELRVSPVSPKVAARPVKHSTKRPAKLGYVRGKVVSTLIELMGMILQILAIEG